MKVLVTGAAGFIGSYVVQELLDHQYSVFALDNLSKGDKSRVSLGATFYEADITSEEIGHIFQYEQPDFVIHLAAQSSVLESMEKPIEDCQANVLGTLNILRFSNQYNVKKVILASSAAVYGNPTSLPVKEDSKLAPLSFYALSKISAENYVHLYEEMFGLKSCILRFSNVYGPNQESGAIASILNRISKREAPIINNGSQTRDFIYVKDVAAACLTALVSHETGVFQISSGTERTINEVFKLISYLTNTEIEPLFKELDAAEIKRSVLSNEKAKNILHWEPHYSMEEGLKEVIQSYSMAKHL